MAKKTKHYVNNPDFLLALQNYKKKCDYAKENSLKEPIIPDYIGICFMKICEKLANRPNFFSYTYKEDMIADAIENCIRGIHSFDVERTNPFAYFTRTAWNAFLRRIEAEKEQSYLKHKNFQNSFLDDFLQEFGISNQDTNDESSNRIIEEFEEKKKQKKLKKTTIEKLLE